ncbi:hypothetical protein KCW65_23395, partial [Mycobacterium tuberculosis]|nr:hypothetical protein [Mycobacterium tuberculosis]
PPTPRSATRPPGCGGCRRRACGRTGFPLGVAYGIWAATGVALTALAGRVLFRERLTRVMIAGIALIIVGVLLIEVGSQIWARGSRSR